MVRASSPPIEFAVSNIIACSLCAGGRMALIMAQVDPDNIRMVGRWQRNTMLRYLHTTTKSFT